MDSAVAASVIGAVATVLAAAVSVILTNVVAKRRRAKAGAQGSADDVIVPTPSVQSIQNFKARLPSAKDVKICGWALYRTVDECRHELRALADRGCSLRILLLNPRSETVSSLDNTLTGTDPVDRRARNWPSLTPTRIVGAHLERVLTILRDNRIIGEGRDIAHLCGSLLPFSLLMVEGEDGDAWACVQIYPLHPDTRFERRFSFVLTSQSSTPWKMVEEQFDSAWEDPSCSFAATFNSGEEPTPGTKRPTKGLKRTPEGAA